MKNYLNKVNDNEINIYLFGDITTNDWKWDESEVSSWDIKELLENFKNVEIINIHINSCGGDVFEGLAIYNLLKEHMAKKIVYIDGIAASIASVIAMVGDEIIMPEASMMMIHNCWTYAVGNSKELRKQADDMDKVMQSIIATYMAKVNIKEDKLKELLDNETYLSAIDCLEMGFATNVIKVKEENITEAMYANMFYSKFVEKLNKKDKKISELEKKLEEKNNIEKESSSKNGNLLELFLNNIK